MELPQHCNILSLGAARIREIKSIVSKLDENKNRANIRVFQKLPRHMQRRAVSSNPRRLPRSLREKHKQEINVSDANPKAKSNGRPSRKYRRRPSNLLQEYKRRSRTNVWLESHIYHAKRFHMVRRFGYVLPNLPTFKGHRASRRAYTKGCLLQDVSYLCCIELEGAQSLLLSRLSVSMMPESVEVLTSPAVLAGRHWMTFMFFSPHRQPYGAISGVDLLFHPLPSPAPEPQPGQTTASTTTITTTTDTDYGRKKNDNNNKNNNNGEDKQQQQQQQTPRKLWLWVHPSAHSEVIDALTRVFELEKVDSGSDSSSSSSQILPVECEDGDGSVVDIVAKGAVDQVEMRKVVMEEDQVGNGHGIEGAVVDGGDEVMMEEKDDDAGGGGGGGGTDTEEGLEAEEVMECKEAREKGEEEKECEMEAEEEEEEERECEIEEENEEEQNEKAGVSFMLTTKTESQNASGEKSNKTGNQDAQKTKREESKPGKQEDPQQKDKKEKENNSENHEHKTLRRRKKEGKKTNVNVNREKLETRNIPYDRTPKYVSVDKSITMTLLKDTLNRFRLTGPNSLKVLQAAFLPASVTIGEREVKVTDVGGEKLVMADDLERVDEKEEEEERKQEQEGSQPWWREYYGYMERLQSHQRLVDVWNQLPSYSHPSNARVLPLTVRDPRVSLPHKKIVLEADESDDVTQSSNVLEWSVESPVYSSDIRDQVTLSKAPDADINKRRSQLLVPGTPLAETDEEERLPVLLLSRPAASSRWKNKTLGEGWEVVVPAGWGMSVFLPLVYCGGVVMGQHAEEELLMEAFTPAPAHLLPDTLAGMTYSKQVGIESRQEFFKRPPNVRVNYIKLGIQFPFRQPWVKLLESWHPGTSEFFILRDSRHIGYLTSLIEEYRKGIILKDVKDRENGQVSVTGNVNSEATETTNASHSSRNGGSTIIMSPDGVSNGKRKAEDNQDGAWSKRAKQDHMQRGVTQQDSSEKKDLNGNAETDPTEEENQPEAAKVETERKDSKKGDQEQLQGKEEEEDDGTSSKKMISEASTHKTDSTEAFEGENEKELIALSSQCLVMVHLVMPWKGAVDPRAVICLPSATDLQQMGKVELKEPPHPDTKSKLRFEMKEEHEKIKSKIKKVKQRAKQRVVKEMDIVTVSQANQTVEEAVAQAMNKVMEDNKLIVAKYESYQKDFNKLWLMDANETFQCCLRPIIGYATHGTFAQACGKAVGLGCVALKPLLDHLVASLRGADGGNDTSTSASPFATIRQPSNYPGPSLPVLVRNPDSHNYRWAQMLVVESPSMFKIKST